MWSTAPSRWLVLASAADLLIASTMANRGVAMTHLPLFVIGATLAGAVAFAFVVDLVKVPVYGRLKIT
jgi:H+-transporting ATPase